MGKRSDAKARQKKWKKYEVELKPALSSVGGSLAVVGVIDPVKAAFDPVKAAAEETKLKKRALRLQARLVDPELKKDAQATLTNDTVSVAPPTAYYVIVGRGAAAVVNHTTLRQSTAGRLRIGDLPVMHIGWRDPWLGYHRHGMGQPPYLLRLPGYHHPAPLNAETVRTGLASTIFAKSTDDEMALLRQKFETYIVDGWVAALEARNKRAPTATRDVLQALGLARDRIDARLDAPWPRSFPRYRLLVVDENADPFLVYAAKVDLCSGGGGGRSKPREAWTVPADLLAEAQTKPWNPSYLWKNGEEDRRIISGIDGLTEKTKWVHDTRVCVYGAGGIGLNQIERAHDENEVNYNRVFIDWFARDFLHDPTFNLRRNDTVLRSQAHIDRTTADPFLPAGGADAVRTTPDDFDTTVHIIPGSPHWRWAHHSKIRKIEKQLTTLRIELYLTTDVVANLALQANPWCEDFWTYTTSGSPGRSLPLSRWYETEHPACARIAGDNADQYHRVILCLGQQQDLPGEPSQVAKGFTFTAIMHDNRMVGLEDDTGNVRILGAGAVMFPGVANIAGNAEMVTYRKSMAASAVPPGFILMGANIAAANGFFAAPQPNRNVNTMSYYELTSMLETQLPAADAMVAAYDIVTLRSWPNNGIASLADLNNHLTAHFTGPGGALNAVAAVNLLLSIDYRTPDVWP